MEKKVIVKELIKDKNVGAVTSTSNKLVGNLLKRIDFVNAKIIIEYGPGTGVITNFKNKMY